MQIMQSLALPISLIGHLGLFVIFTKQRILGLDMFTNNSADMIGWIYIFNWLLHMPVAIIPCNAYHAKPCATDLINWSLGPFCNIHKTENTWSGHVCKVVGSRMIYTLGKEIMPTTAIIKPPVCHDDALGHISMVSCQKGPTCHAYAW